MAVIGALRVNLGLDSAQFGKGLKQAEAGLAKFGAAAKKGLAAAGVAAAGLVTGLGLAVRGTINSADEMSKAAQKFGVPIEELSRLKYAADLSGLSFEGMGNGVRRLSQSMADAAEGVGQGAEAFDKLGIKATDAEGMMKPTSAVLAEIADRFAAMPDGAEKTALAMDLMGRSGANMIPLLNGGADALNRLMAEADSFGQVFTQEMGSQAEAFNDNMSRLKGTFANIAASIARDLLPHLERFSDWLVENGPAIRGWALAIVDEFVKLGQGFAATKAEIDAISGGLQSLVAGFQGVDDSVRQFGAGARAAVAQFAADIVAGFQALDDTIRQWGASARATLGQFASDAIAVLQTLPARMMEIGSQIIDGLLNGLRSKYEAVKASVAGFAADIVASAKGVLGIQSPSAVMHEVGVNVIQGLGEGMQSMKAGLGTIMDGLAQQISTAFSGVIDGTKSVKDAVGDLLRSLGKLLVNQAFQALLGGGSGGILGGLFGGLFGGFSLPGFAHGGTIRAGGSGGIDSQLVAFYKSPSEQVDIYKPGQDRGTGELRISVDVDKSGNIIPVIRDEAGNMLASAAPQIAGSAVRQVDQRLPSMMARHQMRTI